MLRSVRGSPCSSPPSGRDLGDEAFLAVVKRLRLTPRSIRYRLLRDLILSVLLTALAISLVTFFLGTHNAHDRAVAQLKSVQTLKEQEIKTWTDSLRLNLDIITSEASVPADLAALSMANGSGEAWEQAYTAVHGRFLWAAQRMALFEEVFFMDAAGSVLISTNSGHEGQRLALNDYFVEGMKNSYIQQPTYSLSLDKMVIVASAPVRYGAKTIGVIAGVAGLTGLNQIMIERAGLGDTGETYLVGSNYRLLTYLRTPGYSIPDTYIRTDGTTGAIHSTAPGAGTYEGYAGEKVIGVYHWIADLRVALIAEQGEGEALAASRQTLWLIVAVAGLAAVLAILAGAIFTRRIVTSLATLGGTAGRIAGGEIDLEAEVERQDEIGTLADAFNRMTGRLRGTVRSLERRTDHLRAINEAGRHISSILDLEELLPSVAQSVQRTFGYERVHVLLVTGESEGSLLTCSETGECDGPVKVDLGAARTASSLVAVVETERAVLSTCDDKGSGAAGSGGAAIGWNDAGADSTAAVYSEIAVPIRVKQDLVGALGITAGAGDVLDEQDLFAAETLADQLAIAIENTRLYEHAHELAASRERQRLARDLHDAVSQTLFSVSLIAEVVPRIYERDEEQGRQRLEELRQLTRGALAEMRTLLLELRPAALAEANLPDLVKQLGEAVVGRARIPVDVKTEEDCAGLPADVRVALYRIAQEALNNVAKHSGARHASVGLSCDDGAVRLTIADDGSGFDTEAPSGQLGLGIMRERADAVGAALDLRSAPGHGTMVTVTWSPPGDHSNPPTG
jgi:signal transduction histidine kinase